ncbi:Uncharacterised protein [uncultured archaeon]|nr:Uncharacterised protein [uncultured archaeon]
MYLPAPAEEEERIATGTLRVPFAAMSPTACWLAPSSVNEEFSAERIITFLVTPPVFSSASVAVSLSPGWMEVPLTETVLTESAWCCNIAMETVAGVLLDVRPVESL